MADQSSSRQLSINAFFFQEIKDDQIELAGIMARLVELAAVPAVLLGHPREFCDRLAALRDQLALHFALEEAYGYFDEAIESAPRLHVDASRLRGQHAPLYQEATTLVERALEATHEDQLHDAAQQFLDFKRRFEEHEAAERTLIFTAIHQDIGVGD
ncbi:MAG: hypothetical protein KDB03_26505 [Planctomycetales bacterium]|nr:hypothetical protein [Planctomycetales bacterium]